MGYVVRDTAEGTEVLDGDGEDDEQGEADDDTDASERDPELVVVDGDIEPADG